MTKRVLPVAEWSRLVGTPLGQVWQQLPTSGLRVMVVEDAAGQIVGHWSTFQSVHAEDGWIHPDHRKRGVVLRHLIDGMRHEVSLVGASAFISHAETDDVRDLLLGLDGQRLPGEAYSIPVTR